MNTTHTIRFTDTKEFYDLRAVFEKTYGSERLDRESKELYSKGVYYQSGTTNNLFKAFLNGYQAGRVSYM
jgi:hypothetical protein